VDILVPLLSDLAVIGVILVLGGLFSRLLLGPDQKLAVLSLSFPLGGGLLTWIVFLLAWLGIPDLNSSILIAIGIMLLIAWRFGSYIHVSELWTNVINAVGRLRERRPTSLSAILFWLTVGIISISALVISVGRSYSVWDAVAFWSIKAYGMAQDNSMFSVVNWGGHGLTYPLNIPILISIFRMSSGDILPGSKLIFPFYYFSILLGSYRFWNKIGVRPARSRLGILFLASIPIIFEFATVGYSNLPVGCFLALGVLWGIEGIYFARTDFQLVSGILLGLAAWTRPEGIAYSLTGLLVLILISAVSKKGRVYFNSFVLPVLFIGGSWIIFYSTHGGGGSQAMGGVGAALTSVMNGELNLSAIITIGKFSIKNLFSIGVWGLLYPISAVLVVVGIWHHRAKTNIFFWACFFTSLSFGVFTAILFYVGQFQSGQEFLQGWLTRGFARSMIPSGILLGVMCISFFNEDDEQITP
jgi:hypothetical protein